MFEILDESNPFNCSVSIIDFWTSMGMSNKIGPGLPDVAKCKEYSSSYFIVLGSRISFVYFVIDLKLQGALVEL